MSSKPANTILIVVAVIAAAVVGSLATRYFSAPEEKKHDTAILDQAMRKETSVAQIAEALSAHFPDAYEKLLKDLWAVGTEGSEQDIKIASYNFMKGFMREKMPMVVAAQNSAIQKIIDEQVEVITLFKGKSVKLCADFGMRGLGPNSDVDETGVKELGDVVTAQIVAAHDGMQNPVTRTPPTAEDWKKLIAVMKARGASDTVLSKIFILGDLNGLTVEEECEFSYALLVSMADLDEETRNQALRLVLGRIR